MTKHYYYYLLSFAWFSVVKKPFFCKNVDTLVAHMLNWDFLSATCFSRTYSTIQSWPLNIIIFIRTESFQSFKVFQLRQTSGKRGASESLTQSHQHKPSDELCLSAQGFIPPPSSAVSSISGLHWGGGGPSLSNTAGDLQQNNMDSFHSPTARQCLLDLNI